METIQAVPRDVGLEHIVAMLASEFQVPERELLNRSLLQLPRLSDVHGFIDQNLAMAEIAAVASRMPHLNLWQSLPSGTAESVAQFALDRVAEGVARYICESFHYIGSHRPGSEYFGLVLPGSSMPTTLFVVSPIDGLLTRLIADSPIDAECVYVLSRVFSFLDAPAQLFKASCMQK